MLIGFPIKEFEAQLFKLERAEDGTVKKSVSRTVWGNENMFKSLNPKSYQFTGNTRMGYAKPAWVPKYNEKGTILLLDDWTRCTPVFANAVMDLIMEQKYVSWSLPKKTTICLSSNPDNGVYNVTNLDPAQEGRYANFMAEFNLEDWGRWAEKANIDSRAINFALSYGKELFSMDDEGNSIADPRSYVMFANMIGGIKDWDSDDSMSFIIDVAKGCFKDKNNRVGAMFSAFIRNKMHELIQPSTMLKGSWETVQPKLEGTIYDTDGKFRPDVAFVLERRFTNYVMNWLDSSEESPIKTVINRMLQMIRNEQVTGKKLFKEEHYYHMVKLITSVHKGQTGKLMAEPEIAALVG